MLNQWKCLHFRLPFNFSSAGQMLLIPNFPNCVFSFWVGMPLATQNRILELCAACPTVDTITVFLDRKWRTPDAGNSLFGLHLICITCIRSAI